MYCLYAIHINIFFFRMQKEYYNKITTGCCTLLYRALDEIMQTAFFLFISFFMCVMLVELNDRI